MRITLADNLCIDCSTTVSLYLKQCINFLKSRSGVSKSVHVGYQFLCCVLPHLTSNMVLGMDLSHTINPLINWNNYLLSLDCGGAILCILSTQ